ncbi:hypothetical protein AGRA3207_007091 [Actinomadura graeca]|uniref:DUF559 domain-containing protein n=1 Tax=Actinomadura graeca TaxID=2750812 RepID=A0ABX8R3C1_9ACTN|nr:hypothetical protein [Actinomadura graeca]QXJ25576.1 hypothetical protein AGRA3207_007091 [Actinomadura graeca]
MNNITWQRDPTGSISPVGPGTRFIPAQQSSFRTRAKAFRSVLPAEAVVARRTAAWIWGLDVLPPGMSESDWSVELITPRPVDTAPDPPALAPGTVDLPPEHVLEEDDVRVTSLHRTALDCARWLPRAEAVAALDQFLRRGVEAAELSGMARALPGYRGNRRLREIIRLGDRGAASPAESWTRVTVVDTGFPRPATQVPVMGPHGHHLYVDLGYPGYRVGMEYDGERHHTGPKARAHDHRRREWLRKSQGWEIIPVTKDFLSRPAPYLEALLTALLKRGWNPEDATMDEIATRLASLSRRPRRSRIH